MTLRLSALRSVLRRPEMFFHANGIGTENNRSSRFLSLLPRDRTRTRDCRVRPETQWARGFLAKQPGVSAQAGNMQKKIISMAIAGLVSSFAFAQSNVTIYGVMDAGFSSYSYDKGYNSTTGLKDGRDARSTGVYSDGMTSSRLGFKGEENLGNGLKAIFQLETGVQLDSKDGDGAWGGLKIRQSKLRAAEPKDETP